MKRLFAFLLFPLFFLSAPDLRAAEVVERILALVNSEAITLSELEEAGKPMFEQVRQTSLPSEQESKMAQARKQILDLLIESKVLDQEIKNKKIEVPDRDVNMAVEDVLKHNKMTESDLKTALAKEGMTYSLYRQRVKEDLGKMRLINREIKSKIMVKDEDVIKFYNDHLNSFVEPLEIKIQQIFLGLPPMATEEQIAKARAEAQMLLERYKKGENFTKLVNDYSQGPEAKEDGILGFFKHKELRPELEEAAFALNPGEVSQVVQSVDGFHILRVLEKKGGVAKPYAEVQSKIREDMVQAESEKKFIEWMKNLKAKAYIEIRL